jgi:hypothetical protein
LALATFADLVRRTRSIDFAFALLLLLVPLLFLGLDAGMTDQRREDGAGHDAGETAGDRAT